MAEPGSPLPGAFEASRMAALRKLQHSPEVASPLWAVARAGAQMPSVLEARCTAAPLKLPLWALAEPGSPMPDALEAFCTAAPRQLGLAGLLSADPWGSSFRAVCRWRCRSVWYPLPAEKADVVPNAGAIRGQLRLAWLVTANPRARLSAL